MAPDDPGVRDGNSTRSGYKRHRYERLYIKVVYEVFIAPVYAVSMAVGIFLLQLAGVFLVGLVGYVALNYLFSSVLHLPGELPCIASATALVVVASARLPSSNEKVLAACCGISSFISGCLAFGICTSKHASIFVGVGIGAGALAAVLLYWFHLEPGRKSVGTVLSLCYAVSIRDQFIASPVLTLLQVASVSIFACGIYPPINRILTVTADQVFSLAQLIGNSATSQSDAARITAFLSTFFMVCNFGMKIAGYSETEWDFELLFFIVDGMAVASFCYGLRHQRAAFLQPFVVLSIVTVSFLLLLDTYLVCAIYNPNSYAGQDLEIELHRRLSSTAQRLSLDFSRVASTVVVGSLVCVSLAALLHIWFVYTAVRCARYFQDAPKTISPGQRTRD